ncbi:MAG: glycosyltransferase family 39 protein [Planctomycetota bacterium]|nr:glycosyltransferase family 39 protein [Planctomycetota bacterium]
MTSVAAVTRIGPGSYRWLAAIVLAALIARVGIVIAADLNPARFDYPDSHRYVRVARHIAAGDGPIDSGQEVAPGAFGTVYSGTDPAYPTVLALGALLGVSHGDGSDRDGLMRFGRIVNVLFGTAAVALLGILAGRLIDGTTGLIAAAILALDPITIFFHGLVLTETCYVTFLLAGLYALSRADGRRAAIWAAISGGALGVATLTRSSALLLPFVLLPLLWLRAGSSTRRRGVLSIAFLSAHCLLLLPTVTRNHALLGHFIPVRTGSGASLLEALGPWADGGPGMDRIEYPPFPSGADEYERDRISRNAALEWTRSNPRRALALAWTKLRRTWSVEINAPGYSSGLYVAIGWLTVAPVFACAAAGAWTLRKRPWTLAFLLAPAVYFTLLHMVFVGSIRYRLPAMPCLFVLAAVAIHAARRRLFQVRCPETRPD